MEWRHPSIVAMKGLPYTGKSSFAKRIAYFHVPSTLITLDEILDSLVSFTTTNATSSSPTPLLSAQEPDQLNSVAFDVICQIVSTQLSLGVSVVIDSPLLLRSHLDQLVSLSSSQKITKFIIVECRAELEYTWQMRFEQRDQAHRNKWYKPRTWKDVDELIQKDRNHGWSLDNEAIPGVSRLLVNVDNLVDIPHLVQAVQALVFCEGDHYIDFDKWKETHMEYLHDHYDHDHQICIQKPNFGFCSDGHNISVLKKERLAYEANCGVCEGPVSDAAYSCVNCKMALHDHCAELEAEKRAITPQKFPHFFHKSPPAYSFPENHPCIDCRQAGKGFSEKCGSCIFESHMKCGLVPTILKHDGHPHKLHFWARPVQELLEYRCAACGEVGTNVGYRCLECIVLIHVECALLPHPALHEHGGYEHWLELRFSRDEVLEDYCCDFCQDRMTPVGWFYRCEECDQTYHLYCVFKDDGSSS